MKTHFSKIATSLAIAALIFGVTTHAGARSRTIKPKAIEGKPAVEFTGTVKEVITNALPFKIVVDGSSNSNSKDSPKGSVTFDVQASCHIKAGGGASGTFADLKVGQNIGIRYSSEGGGKFQAQSIDLDAKAPSTTAASTKKK